MSNSEDDSISAVFDNILSGVQSDRARKEQAKLDKRLDSSEGWFRTISGAKALKEKVSAHPKIKDFRITRDLEEIHVKVVKPGAPRGEIFYILSKEHPAGKYPGMSGCWLTQTGSDDKHFSTSREALEELTRRLALQIA